MMLAPATALLGVFIIVPMLLTIWLSLTQEWSTQTGFETADLRRRAELHRYLRQHFGRARLQGGAAQHGHVHARLGGGDPAAVGAARRCSSTRRSRRAAMFLRTVLFSTYMVPMIAVALVLSKLYSPTEGPLNQILGWVGIPPADLAVGAADARWSRSCILNVWQQVGYFTVLAVAGLDARSPPRSTKRPRIDGANALQQLLSRSPCRCCGNTLLFSAVIAIINAVQVFEPVALITQGGPVERHQCAHLPHPPRRHRTGAGRARLGHGRDADAVADHRRRAAVRLRPLREEKSHDRCTADRRAASSAARPADRRRRCCARDHRCGRGCGLPAGCGWSSTSLQDAAGNHAGRRRCGCPATPNLDAYCAGRRRGRASAAPFLQLGAHRRSSPRAASSST